MLLKLKKKGVNILEQKILQILTDNGFAYENNIMVSEMDSFQYMSALVNLEEDLGFEFPDEYLGKDLLSDLSRLMTIIQKIVNG